MARPLGESDRLKADFPDFSLCILKQFVENHQLGGERCYQRFLLAGIAVPSLAPG